MENKKILGLLGLAARARKVAFGADSVETEIKNKKVHLIIVSEEASDRTKEKFNKLSEEFGTNILIIDKTENLSKAIGKSNKAVLGIKDINIVKEIEKINNGGEVIG